MATGSLLLLMSGLLPLSLATAAFSRHARPWLPALAMAAPLPALALALVGAEQTLDLPWVVLGTRLGLDGTGRAALALSATVWLAAAVYSWRSPEIAAHRTGYYLSFLLAMAGSLVLPLAQDAITFYVAFSLMGLAPYWLVAHFRTAKTDRAARWYLALTLVGELALFVGILMSVVAIGPVMPAFSGAIPPAVALALAALGLAIKAGLVPFHLWLPLAHPAAPVAASAVLSGVMVKAAVVGALRFLPPESLAFAASAEPLAWLGAATATYAAVVGLMQTGTKAALAYSTVSQMGLLALAVSLYVSNPTQAASLAVLLFVLHHGFSKAALFLGLGIRLSGARAHLLLLLGLALPAAALAGLPLTGGAAAKGALKYLAGESWVFYFISASSVLTTLLMLRILCLQQYAVGAEDRGPSHPACIASWLAVTLCAVFWPFAWSEAEAALSYSLTADPAFSALWPVVLGMGVAALATMAFRKSRIAVPEIPAGDVASLVRIPAIRLDDETAETPAPTKSRSSASNRAARAERAMGEWWFITISGTLLLAALFFTLL